MYCPLKADIVLIFFRYLYALGHKVEVFSPWNLLQKCFIVTDTAHFGLTTKYSARQAEEVSYYTKLIPL